METKVEPEITNTTEFKCRKARCREQDLVLGVIVQDKQAIEFGNVLIWHTVRFSCSNCQKSYWFQPKPIKEEV